MYKLLLFPLLMVSHMMLAALQFDEELAMQVMFRAKYSVNYAVHAAAQQVDELRLAEGVYTIDPASARQVAQAYLQENLQLDSHNEPLSSSILSSPVEILVFEVIGAEVSFPYTYVHEVSGFHVTLGRPGVVMIAQVQHPRTFSVLGPIQWEIRGSAELLY